MNYLEKHPFIMIVIGVMGISLSAIFVKLSQAPSVITATFRLLWTVILMSPIVIGKKSTREELFSVDKKTFILCCISGLFLAIHFTLWFESLQHTSVASSTAIVCTEVIWVSFGYCLFMKGKLSKKEILIIAFILSGSLFIAFSDSTSGKGSLFGDVLSLLSAMAVAVYMLIGKAARTTVSTSVYTYIVYSACATVLLLLTCFMEYGLFNYGYSAIIVGILLALFSTILGHSIFSWCLKYFSPSFVSASKLCEPVVASIIAIFLFNEIPSAMQILGGIIIISGVLYYSKIEKAN